MSFLWTLLTWWVNLANEVTNIAWGLQDEWWCPTWLKVAISVVSNFIADITMSLIDVYWWVDNLVDLISQYLTWDQIVAGFNQLITWVNTLWSWFSNWWGNVTSVISNWWSGMISTVQGWIDAAVQGLSDLIVAWDNFWNVTWPSWISSFNWLSAAWDNFWNNIFPDLVDFSWLWSWWTDRLQDVQNLINSAFLLYEDFWKGWQDIRDTVYEYFQDPVEWIWERFTDWFLGPEG